MVVTIINPVMKNKTNLGELLIILVVMGILGWITYGQFEIAKAKSRDIDRKGNLNDLGLVIRLYYADYGVLPSEKIINSLWGKEWRDGAYVYSKKVSKENYLDKEYCYQIEDGGISFSLFADLEYKADKECIKDNWQCGGQNYCYRRLLTAEVEK
jgi:hypothetical protein